MYNMNNKDYLGLNAVCVTERLVFNVYFQNGRLVANAPKYNLKYISGQLLPQPSYLSDYSKTSVNFKNGKYSTLYCHLFDDVQEIEMKLANPSVDSAVDEIRISYLLFQINHDNKYLVSVVAHANDLVCHYGSSALHIENHNLKPSLVRYIKPGKSKDVEI